MSREVHGPVRTCAERAVVLSPELSHDADSVGGRLPDLGTLIAQGLQHPLDKVLCVLERGRAAVLYDVVEDAQAPLPVSPRPVGTLKPSGVSDGDGLPAAAKRTRSRLLSAGQLVAAGAQTKAAPSPCSC